MSEYQRRLRIQCAGIFIIAVPIGLEVRPQDLAWCGGSGSWCPGLQPQPHIAVHGGLLGGVHPHHACEARQGPQRVSQCRLGVVGGEVPDPGTVQRDHCPAPGRQYAPDLADVLGNGGLVAEMHSVAGEGPGPLAPIASVPLWCQELVAIGLRVGIHTPYGGIELPEPVVATADVHTGQGADLQRVQEVERQAGGHSNQCILPGGVAPSALLGIHPVIHGGVAGLGPPGEPTLVTVCAAECGVIRVAFRVHNVCTYPPGAERSEARVAHGGIAVGTAECSQTRHRAAVDTVPQTGRGRGLSETVTTMAVDSQNSR